MSEKPGGNNKNNIVNNLAAAKSVEKSAATGRPSMVATDDRRRSQRVMMRVAVVVRYSSNGKEVSQQAHTVAVNIHGAMICATENIPAETALDLEHQMTKERIAGRVTRQAQHSPEGFLIPVEFVSPSNNFWRISFPPSDWKPTDA
jgi:hypothetical protein